MSKSSQFPLSGQVAGYQSEESWALQNLDKAYNPASTRLESDYAKWSFKNPDITNVPPRFEPLFRSWERKSAVNAFKVLDPNHGQDIEQIKNQLDIDIPGHNKRREQELKLADYIERVVAPLGSMEYKRGDELKRDDPFDIMARLRSCRQAATIGLKPGGGFIAVYDEKCGYSKLCPDESREESQRLSETYIPALVEFKKQHRNNTFQYAVFTLPNFPVGELASGKKEINDRFSKLLKRKCMQHVAGSLVIQEDPLSASGDWNVHLNVMMAIDGPFDWKAVRNAWGANIHFDSEDNLYSKTRANLQRKGIDSTKMDDITVLTHAFRELAKYAGSPISTKSAKKADDGQSEAPAMTEWSGELWREWWVANKGFRRTRSYGVLFDSEGYRWEVAPDELRGTWLRSAFLPSHRAICPWRKSEASLDKDERDLLRDAMNEREVLNLEDVEWVGSMRYHEGSGYRVLIDLIPEDKSVFSTTQTMDISSHPHTGPPPDIEYGPNFDVGAGYVE